MIKKTAYLSVFLLVAMMTTVFFTTSDTEKLRAAISVERDIAGLQQKSVQVDDHHIQYLEGGSGPVILMIHGFGANKDNWIRIAKYFTDKYRVIAPDLPGFGESTILNDGDYDAEAQVQRLNRFLNALEVEQVHITGNSMGGYIAGHFSSRFPNRVKTTWLLNPLGMESAAPSEMFQMFSKGEHPYVLPRNEQEFRLLLTKVFYEIPYTPDFAIRALTKDFQQHYQSNERIAHQIHQIRDGKVYFSHPLEKSLPNYPNPLLVIWGDDDKILSPDGLRVISEHRPQTTAIMMKNMGHAPMIEAPEQTAMVIQTFLESHQTQALPQPKQDNAAPSL